MYSIYQDRGHHADVADVNEAIELADVLLGGVNDGEKATFSVENKDRHLLASITNRRIIGSFVKQQWGGRKGNDAIHVGDEEFDATDAILLTPHEEVMELRDGAETSDNFGRAHIDWSGPCEVHIVGPVCDYFGVGNIEEITPEALAFAKNRANPQPATEETITLSIKLQLRMAPGAQVSDFIENLDYSMASKTVGVTITNTEIVDSE
jgi:hypothetical protein